MNQQKTDHPTRRLEGEAFVHFGMTRLPEHSHRVSGTHQVKKSLGRVLVVEDDLDIQIVVSLVLSELGGLVVEVCGSAPDALDAARTFRPDLIVLDVMMPGTDGLATFAALREDPGLAATPVVFMTARAQSHEVTAYRKLGALGVITKPFDPETLADTLRTLWEERHDG